MLPLPLFLDSWALRSQLRACRMSQHDNGADSVLEGGEDFSEEGHPVSLSI